MKKFSLLLIMLISVGLTGVTYGQTITVGASPTSLPCGGGNVNFTALGNSTVPVFGDNFNNGTVASGWSASPAAQFNNPCGPSVDGTTYLWMGPTTAAPREMTTASVDVSCGGTVCFDFKFTCESCGDSSPCEGADAYNEGVSLQYSINGGATWVDFAYFAPNGNILTAWPGSVYSPYASGTTPFTTWHNYCFTIPAGAQTSSTMFQLHQWGSSGTGFDHWGIDNFYVYANPCAPYYYDWGHIPGSPDSPNVTANVTSSGWYDCCYTNGTNSVCDSVFITVDNMILNPINTTVEACLGDNTGTASISVTGGTGPYTYTIAGAGSGSNATGNFSNLAPGNYTVTVTGSGGCSVNGNFTITPGPACCTVSATGTDALCNGGSTGSATANPANGIAPYTYQWDAGTGNQTTQTASNLPAGTYNVTITDFAGCQSTTSVTIGQPAVLAANATPTMVSCFNVCDGQIAVSAPTGGTAAYQYNINGGTFGASGTFTGLCDGTYNIIVKDANGCQLPLSNIAITEPTDVTLVQGGTTPATCGANNGTLNVTAGGGTPPYQYNIGGANQASSSFTGLAAATYTVTVADANGCTETVSVTVASSAGPAPFVDILHDVACAGALTGDATIGVTGGQAPFQYSIDAGPNQASNFFAGLSAGAHTVTVTDANGCTGTVNLNISQPSGLTFTTVVTDASCNGVCDGQISVTANNATPPYTYSSDNGLVFQASNVLTGLCAGAIQVVVKDANGCLANDVVDVFEPTPVTLTPSFVEPSCHGLADGSITFAGAGGTPAYQYSVNNGSTFSGSDPVTGIAAGTYNLVIEDANGCQETGQITVTEPPAFDFVFIANNPSNCGANDGSFEIIALNGSAPYTYSITGTGGALQPSGFFGSLFSGLYNLVCIDANGCIDSTYSALSDNVMVTQVDFEVSTSCYNSCDGVAIVSQQFGAPPFTYTINTGGSQGTGDFFGLCAGQHFITIEDNGLCLGIQEVNIPEPDTILVTAVGTDPLCFGGSDGIIDVNAGTTGGTGGPYTYSIDGVNFQAGLQFTGLTQGTYTITAKDGLNCLGTFDITLSQPTDITINLIETDLVCNGDNTGFVQVVAGGGTPAFSYNLNGNVNATGVYPLLAASPVGGYPITVTDANGCTADTVQVVNEPPLLTAIYNPTDAQCNGSADGTIAVTANGGTAPYVYSPNNGTTFQSNSTLSGLAAGSYDVLVKDDNGCTTVSNILISEPTPVTMTITLTPETCGQSNATIDVNGSGGTGAFTYYNDGGVVPNAGAPNFVFNGLTVGNFVLVVEDANGCQADSMVTTTADNTPQIDNLAVTHLTCNASGDGQIVVTASSGVGAYTYSLDAGAYQASNTFSGLSAGTYDVNVQDANGCIATLQTTITEPAVLTLGDVVTDLTCNGNSTGQIVLSSTGGTQPYQFSITGGAPFQAGGTFSFIQAGTYNTVVEDANGCQLTGTSTVAEPNALAWQTFVITDPVCANACDGTVTTVVTGGTAPYSYNWGGNIAGSVSPNATNVCASTYNVGLTDANGCQMDTSFTLVDPPALVIPGVTVTDQLCFDGIPDLNNPGVVVNTGQIDITQPVTGTAPYNYSIDGGTSYVGTNSFTGLTTGNYDISVTDANGCEAISNVTIYQPDSLYSLAPSDWPACYGEDVFVQAFTNGGTVPYASFTWTDDLGSPAVNTPMFTYTVFDTTVWTYVVTDPNGCTAAAVSYTIMPTPPLTVTAFNDSWICVGESVDLSAIAAGGELIDFGVTQDYSYSWNTGNANDTLVNVTVSPTVDTDYIITVNDLCGMTATDTVTVVINPQPTQYFDNWIMCAGDTLPGYIDLSVLYAPGYTVSWDFGNGGTSTNLNPGAQVYANAGVYDVTITVVSDSGCVESWLVGTVTVNDYPIPGFYTEPNSPSVLDPAVQIVDISENAMTYYYTFGGYGSSSDPQPYIEFPIEEEAVVEICQTVTSPEGCVATICSPLDIHEEILFYVPNVFTPDGDLFNESFFPVFTSGVDPYEYHLTIFNRWGETIFESFNYDFGWNGHYGDGGLVDDGVYIWQIEFGEKLSDKKQTHRGHVTVLK
ncbi:MAG: gliding motility-associated C-terminal domain-containing protein [Crocinitomicaceae bacterium]|nr:gliding motility-associated C-terminal domain-containing protein [Crocinitomicaceae bacterium]